GRGPRPRAAGRREGAMRFDDHVVFVTGAGSGIGRATAHRLAREGAAVLCFDRNDEAARTTVREIHDAGGRAASAQGDVRDRASLERALQVARDAFGKVTDLVNNAGVVTMQGLEDLTEEAWDLVVDVNLKGTFLATQVVSPAIAADGGGAIVNLSTVEAEVVVASA